MSLSTPSNRVVAPGDGTTTTFNFNLLLYDATHLQVYLGSTLQTTGYTVNGVPGTGTSVTFTTAPGSGVQVLMLRVVPLTQLSVYDVGGAFPAKTTEKNFDLSMMALQQFDEINDRAVTLPVTSTLTATSIPDPGLPANFGKGLRIKGDGTGLDTFDMSATPYTSPLTTKGDLAVYSTTPDRLAVGANGHTIVADNTAGQGLKYIPRFDEITTKGDLIVGTAADTVNILTVGGSGTIPMARSAASTGLAYVAALTKAIYGFTYANNATDATNDIDFAAGGAMDATGAYWLTGAALTKQLDAAWAVGTNQGMLDTGAVGDTDYYLWVIGRSDTGVVDYLASLSSSAPTMPTNYNFKRLIGWLKRVAGTNVAFRTYETAGGGIDFRWTTPTLDINLTNTLTTSRRTDAIKVPLTFSVLSHIRTVFDDGASYIVTVCSPDETDAAPSISAAPLSVVRGQVGVTNAISLWINTSDTGTIAARADTTMNTYLVVTLGFIWARRN